MQGVYLFTWKSCAVLGLCLLGATGCGTRAERPAKRWPEVEVVAKSEDAPPGSDGAKRLSLAFVYADGSRVPIEGHAHSFAPFRDGVAMVDDQRRLVLISPRGARRVLAQQAGAAPVRGSKGELVYVARHGLSAELHVLRVDGRDRILASGFANAGVLAPQPGGRVFFVAARSGGVAGLWLADADGARCLTNCDLGPPPWDGAFVPSPGDRHAIEVRGDRVRWEAFDGTHRSVSLRPSKAPVPEVPVPEAPGRKENGESKPEALGEEL